MNVITENTGIYKWKMSLCLIYLQVEFHPFQQPLELVEYCRKENIVFEGYCPLAKGQALSHPSIMELAQKYGRSASQICIRWSIQVQFAFRSSPAVYKDVTQKWKSSTHPQPVNVKCLFPINLRSITLHMKVSWKRVMSHID